jgi:hypothetical protein
LILSVKITRVTDSVCAYEQVIGSCHFTVAAQFRGLKQGAELAQTLNKKEKFKFWNEQAENALCFFQV